MRIDVRQIGWLAIMNSVLIIAHATNDNPQTISKWLAASNKLLDFDAPSDNWYGPTAAVLITPFNLVASKYLFFATAFYFTLGSIFYYELIIKLIRSKRWQYIGLAMPFANPYLYRLIDSSPDTVFEYFLLTLMMWCVTKNSFVLFAISGIALAELRSGYWLLVLILSVALVLRNRTRKSLITLIVFPSLIIILFLNLILYGIFAPASEGARTAYFSNNKYAYLLESSYQIDHFFDGVNGPMREFCKSDNQCNSNLLADLQNNKKETIYSLMNKADSYFFSVQKVPRLPGWFELDTDSSSILIGNMRITWANTLASFAYFIYKSVLHISLIFSAGVFLFIFNRAIRKRIDSKWLALPWLIGSIPAVLFFAETRVWIISELLLIPFVIQVIENFKPYYKLNT